jgi:two-component system, OmpR family, sensor histidine kinase KdpD
MADKPAHQGNSSHPVETIHLVEETWGEEQPGQGRASDSARLNLKESKAQEHEAELTQSSARGKLKVFFSFAPGTGKTMAMLKDAQRRKEEGMDVVVGFVDAHGEMQALQLLEKFEILPQVIISGNGLSYHGMNLNKLLARKPQLVLVDHLAQPNPPGLRHEKRYLEVVELLDAGIDVYTTLNIFQLESQVDTVAYLTGVMFYETVADQFLDSAERLEMVDLPPQELLTRYRSGLVFVPSRAADKMEKFFQLEHLFSMRELALRYLAQRSNRLMRFYLPPARRRGAAGDSSLLVCISGNPDSARVVRAGRRMADETRVDWTVLYVETPGNGEDSAEQQAVITGHMRLAELLGARMEMHSGRSVAEGICSYARKNHIDQVMVGKSERKNWLLFPGNSLAEQIQREDPTVTIFEVGSDQTPHLARPSQFWTWMARMHLPASLLLVVLPTVLGLALTPAFISRSANVVMLYLLAVVIAAFFLGMIPAILTALLSGLVYDFFFIPPVYRLFNFAPENAITYFGLLVIGFVISTLVSRERALAHSAQRRANQVSQLYELSRDLASAGAVPDILETIILHVQRTFERDAVILLPQRGELVLSASNAGKNLDSGELTAAEWAFQQGRMAGHDSGTFSYAKFRFIPLEASRGIIGVLGVRLAGIKPDLHPEQVRMLSVYTTKAALAVERGLYAEEASQAEILRATEKLQTALLNSISHDLRTPLASITGVLSSLRMDKDYIDAETLGELVETAYGEAERLNRLVGNLLDMTRLESGILTITLQPCDMQDVIGAALNSLAAHLDKRPVGVDIPDDLPLAGVDFVLVQQVLINLLENAAKYSGDADPITLRVRAAAKWLVVTVEDTGPGVAEEDLERIFEKFFRVKRFENVVGTGLGLCICKGIIEVHGGRIWAKNRPTGGLCISFTLPIWAPAEHDSEPEAREQPEEVEKT